jgi:hypothetical protein
MKTKYSKSIKRKSSRTVEEDPDIWLNMLLLNSRHIHPLENDWKDW